MSDDKNILIEQSVDAIIKHAKLDDLNWEEFSLVLGFNNGELNMTSGYAYEPEGQWTSISIIPRLITNEIAAYKDSLTAQSNDMPLKILFQFNRNSGRFHSELEYNDASKWKATPRNIKSFSMDIKPNLD